MKATIKSSKCEYKCNDQMDWCQEILNISNLIDPQMFQPVYREPFVMD